MSFNSPRPDAVAHNLLLPAAEMGLLYRPIHLLVGHLPWSECLSPYTRDLTITLDQFALRKAAAGQPLKQRPAHPPELEDWYYEMAELFTGEESKRLDEKRRVEANLGIMRLYQDYPRTLWLDAKRIDWPATDSRVSSLNAKLGEPSPVWMVIHPSDFPACESLVQELMQKLNRQLLSCTFEAQSLSLQDCAGPAKIYTYSARETSQSIYQGAAQTLAQTLGETIHAPAKPEQPQTPQPKAGPLHRIKA